MIMLLRSVFFLTLAATGAGTSLRPTLVLMRNLPRWNSATLLIRECWKEVSSGSSEFPTPSLRECFLSFLERWQEQADCFQCR